MRTSLVILLLALSPVCTPGQNCIKTPVLFYDFNSFTLSPSNREILDSLVSYLKDYDSLQLEVFSFTDSKGSALSNKSLSEKRNKAVIEYLIFAGIARDRIKSFAMGEKYPLYQEKAGNGLPGAQGNRRTEFKIK